METKPINISDAVSDNSDSEDYSESDTLEVGSFPKTNTVLKPVPEVEYNCILCDHKVKSTSTQPLLEHLLVQHHFVVGDVEKVADLVSYVNYWKDRFKNEKKNPQAEFTTEIITKDDAGNDQRYHLLSDILPEDRTLRNDLQKKRLNAMLKRQKEEREFSNVSFNRKCLFCKDRYGKRKDYFAHLYKEHNCNIGSPENLVDVDDLLDLLQYKMENCICLYCEKTFKNYSVLKLHMRKKKHFRVNSKNKDYDRFYIVNYLEEGKNWKDIESEVDSDPEEQNLDKNKDVDWNEWEDEVSDASFEEISTTVCLFCENISNTAEESLEHCKKVHGFDFKKLQSDWKLDFYSSIRLINFIRHQISSNSCPQCDVTFESPKALFDHLHAEKHYGAPQEGRWKKEELYLQPINEDDPLLRSLSSFGDFDDDEKDQELESENIKIESEDVNIKEDRIMELEKYLSQHNLS